MRTKDQLFGGRGPSMMQTFPVERFLAHQGSSRLLLLSSLPQSSTNQRLQVSHILLIMFHFHSICMPLSDLIQNHPTLYLLSGDLSSQIQVFRKNLFRRMSCGRAWRYRGRLTSF